MAAYAHNYVGLEHGRPMVAARVQSPNAQVTEFPLPIAGTELSLVCFRVRNTSEFDARITAIGLDLPGDLTGFTLVSPTDSDFHLIEQVSQVPGLPDATLDLPLHRCLIYAATSTRSCGQDFCARSSIARTTRITGRLTRASNEAPVNKGPMLLSGTPSSWGGRSFWGTITLSVMAPVWALRFR
jgi:hypothetical protein